MTRDSLLYTERIGIVIVIFGAGFLCGSMTQQNAEAQLGDLGRGAMKRAEESGGVLGSAAKLGTAINDIQTHVNGLQKNIDSLKAVRAALGGAGK